MPAITIRHKENETVLYKGNHTNIKSCVEAAIAKHIALRGADLRYLNLSHANLDDADLVGADLTGSNLTGANLSEARLDDVNFTHCSLESACLAYSSLTNANFTNARFGGTYIDGAIIDRATFTGGSCFHLDFIATESMRDCHYIAEDGTDIAFSAPPLLLHGLSKPCVVIGNHIRIGTALYTPAQLRSFKDPALHRYRALLEALTATINPRQLMIKAA